MRKGMQTRARRQRHQAKQFLNFGPKAVPKHRGKSGRTGKMRSSQLKNSKRGKAKKSNENYQFVRAL